MKVVNRETWIIAGGLLLTLALSLLFHIALGFFWNHFPDINPLSHWFLDCCAGSDAFTPAIFLHDYTINILLAIPLAMIIRALCGRRLLWFGLAAVVPGFLLFNSHLFGAEMSGEDVMLFLPGWWLQLTSLPMALLLLMYMNRRKSTAGIQST